MPTICLLAILLQLQTGLLGEPDLTVSAEQLTLQGGIHQKRYLYHLKDTIEGYPGVWLITVSRRPGKPGFMEWVYQADSPLLARDAFADLAKKLEFRLLKHDRPVSAKYPSTIWWNSQSDVGYSLQYADSSRVVLTKNPPRNPNKFRSSKPPVGK